MLKPNTWGLKDDFHSSACLTWLLCVTVKSVTCWRLMLIIKIVAVTDLDFELLETPQLTWQLLVLFIVFLTSELIQIYYYVSCSEVDKIQTRFAGAPVSNLYIIMLCVIKRHQLWAKQQRDVSQLVECSWRRTVKTLSVVLARRADRWRYYRLQITLHTGYPPVLCSHGHFKSYRYYFHSVPLTDLHWTSLPKYMSETHKFVT